MANFGGHDELIWLNLSENKLKNCAGLSAMPQLTYLNLNGNQLTSLSALCGLGSLKKLDIGNNKLEGLSTFPVLPELEVLDANTNLIEANGDKELAHLHECTALTTIIMSGNPWVDEKGDDFKKEVLIALSELENIKANVQFEDVTSLFLSIFFLLKRHKLKSAKKR